MEARDFWRDMVEPTAPDEMHLALRREPEQEGTFSIESVGALTDNLHDFILARLHGRWQGTGEPPRRMTVQTRIVWDALPDDLMDMAPRPWWAADDTREGMLTIEEHRRREATG